MGGATSSTTTTTTTSGSEEGRFLHASLFFRVSTGGSSKYWQELRGKEQMYSPSRGDVRAAVPPPKVQHDSTSSSMPLEHSSAWHREPPLYTRDGRVERLDRNASVKRDWSAEQAAAMPVNHKAIGLSSTNGNGLGHRSKHRVQGNCFSSEMFQVVETQVFLLCRQNGEASFLHALFCVVKFGSTM